MTTLGGHVGSRRSFLDMSAVPALTEATEPLEVAANVFAFRLSRSQSIAAGLVEPNEAERAEMKTWKAKREAREAALTVWFAAVSAVAGPVGVAMLDLHVPDKYGDCKGCGFEELSGIAWPCTTVLAGAEAAGLPEPELS